jgi:hypothetical protein
MTIEEKIKFIDNYKKADNAASGSTFDPNANVTEKNICTLAGEVNKKDNIDLQRAVMYQYLTKAFGKELADQYEKDLSHHSIYRHDESLGAGGFPYCVSVSLYPFLLNGLKDIGGTTTAPQHVDSYIGGLVNLIYIVAGQFAGAVAAPETLTYMDHFLRKDYGEDWPDILDNVVEFRKKKQRKLKEKIEDWFAEFVYSINQPAAARNFQSVFFNIAYFDKYYFESIFKDFVFPDGDEPKWETTKVLQQMFMKWFNAERLKAILTFPVETMNILVDKDTGEYKDKEMADFAAEMWSEGASFFMYQSDSVDALASCCFDGDQMVLTKDSDGVKYMTFKEIYELKWRKKKNFTIYHNGSWVKGKTIKTTSKEMYRIKTSNNKIFVVTGDHINPTILGDKPSRELTTDDYLLFSTNALDTFPGANKHLTYDEGYLLGLYAGDGSSYLAHKEGHDFKFAQVSFHLNHEKNDRSIPHLEKALKDLNVDSNIRGYDQKNNNYSVQINSREVYDFIKEYVLGGYAYDKVISEQVLTQSKDFRQGIIDGLYDSDGGNTNRIYSCSKKLIDSIEFIMTSLGYCSKIEVQDRRDEPVVIRGESYKRNFIVYSIRWYDPKNKRSMKDVYIFRNNSMYFKIDSIEKLDLDQPQDVYCFKMKDEEEPYFTLPSGLITHNCRLRNAVEAGNVFSYTLGAGSIETGSKAVITMDLNRIIQDWYRDDKPKGISLSSCIDTWTTKIHKYLSAFNDKLWDDYDAGLLPIYRAGFISLDKQYLTVGINGFVEAAEFLGAKIDPDSQDYRDFAKTVLQTIEDANKRDRNKKCRYNLEFVPSHFCGHVKSDLIDLEFLAC